MVVMLGLFGAALLYGDGMITPAISVLSAMEGLVGRAPALGHFVVPSPSCFLVVLFLVQKHGTAGVGACSVRSRCVVPGPGRARRASNRDPSECARSPSVRATACVSAHNQLNGFPRARCGLPGRHGR
jgi:hypothetical protein